MLAFQGSYLALIVIGGAGLAGNTFFPIFLRLTIWTIAKIVPAQSKLHHSLTFLLHHPRRCFILLFPLINTWYLTAIQIALHLLLWIFWIILQIDFPSITSIPPGNRTISGLFQAINVRSVGLSIISMSEVAPALLVLYTAAMYISALPVIISIRSTNVYEERSLGVQKPDKSDDEPGSERSYIGVGTILTICQGVPTDSCRSTCRDSLLQMLGGSSSASFSSASWSATHSQFHPRASTYTPSSSKRFLHSVTSGLAQEFRTTHMLSVAHGIL